MLIRNGISAPADNLDAIREQMNGWFADAAKSLDFAPRATVLADQPEQGGTHIHAGANTKGYVLHSAKEAPDYVFFRFNGGKSVYLNQSAADRIWVESSPSIPRRGVFILAFLDRSLDKEAEQESSGDPIFSKR